MRKRMSRFARRMSLLNTLACGGGWVPSSELVELYMPLQRGRGFKAVRTARKMAERELAALKRDGAPIDHKPGFWRMTRTACRRWLEEL
jgi:hypothetical protein